MNIVILTEGGKEMGWGHVTRCLSVYQAFMEYNITPHLIVNGDDSILPDIDYSVSNWIDDLSFIDSADIVIVDSYLAEEEFYKNISSKVPLAVYFDDNNRTNYPEGLIVNGTLNADNLNYPKGNLIGREFIPLRKEFWNTDELKINEDIENILVILGGGDLRNLTFKILNLLNKNYPSINKKVIVNRKVNKSEFQSDNVEFFHSPKSDELIKIMLSCDLAISGSGQTLYELARVGLPTVAVGIIDNQRNNILNWKKQGFIEYTGCWSDEDLLDNISDKISLLKDKNIRENKNQKGLEAVSGEGSLKIVRNILNRFYIENSSFRPAEKKDCLNIFKLSNDVEVRKNSFNCDKISLKDHKVWFENVLKDDTVKFYVLEYENDLIGQLRFNLKNNESVISISLNRKYRRLGLSKFLLSRGLSQINNKAVAYVKITNKASVSFFKSMGFELENENNETLKFVKE